VDYLTAKLRENFTGQLLSVTINIDDYQISGTKLCTSIANILTGIENQGLNKDWLVVKNSSNSNLPYFIEGNGLSIKTGTKFDGFFKVYSSKDIDSSKCTPKTCVGNDCYISNGVYTITSVGQMNETFLKKARRFRDDYNLNSQSYETIKTQLKVPKNIEFNFELKTTEGESINTTSSKIPPTGTNVYVGEIPILYIDESANLESGFLTVKVW
jgi:hypothetical protein